MKSLLPMAACIERRERLSARAGRPIAPAVYIGFQEGFGPVPSFHLWSLVADIAGHKAGSTVSSNTLISAGYRLPTS